MSCTRIAGFSRAFVTLLLSVLLAVQVATAFLPVAVDTRVAGNDSTVVICSADGLRMITLPDGGAESEPPAPAAAHGHCPLCILTVDLPPCANLWAVTTQIESSLCARLTAVAQTCGQLDWRPGAIRAPPQTV